MRPGPTAGGGQTWWAAGRGAPQGRAGQGHGAGAQAQGQELRLKLLLVFVTGNVDPAGTARSSDFKRKSEHVCFYNQEKIHIYTSTGFI